MNNSSEHLNEQEHRTKQLIQEIAARHGIVIGKNDPILMLYTLNEQLIKHSTLAQQQLLAKFKSELEELCHRQQQEAQERAQKLLNSALSASKTTLTQETHEAVRLVSESLRNEVDAATAQLAAPISHIKKVAILNIAAASLAIAASIIVALALW